MGPVGVVVDTNVLVSALGFRGTPLEALLRMFDGDIQLLASEATLTELDRVLGYDHLPFTEDDRIGYVSILAREAELVVPETEIHAVDRDPDDNRFLECAVAGDARFIVSGDDHLLDLGSVRGIDIVTPAAFLQRLESKTDSQPMGFRSPLRAGSADLLDAGSALRSTRTSGTRAHRQLIGTTDAVHV